MDYKLSCNRHNQELYMYHSELVATVFFLWPNQINIKR